MSDKPVRALAPAPRRPAAAQVPAAETPGLIPLLTLAVGVVIVAGLYLAREVLIPITLAILLSFVLAPLANLLRRLHCGRVPSVLLAVVLSLGIILSLGGLIGEQIAQLAGNVPAYQSTITAKVRTVQEFAASRFSDVMGSFGRQAARSAPPQSPAAAKASGAPPPPMPVQVQEPPLTPFDMAERIITPVVSPLSTMAIVFIVAIFMLLQREDLRDRMIRLFGSGDLHRTTDAMDDAASRLSRYFLTQLAINATFGVIIAIGLFAIGVPSPVLWGVLGALLRFVPYIGAPLSAIFPLALAAAVDPGWSMALWTAGLYLVVEATMGQAVEPLLYGHSTGLSPFAVVVAATFWTWLWGPIGLILSTPLTLCLVVLGRHVDRLEFLDVMLGDRPALTPAENFYQRMLAGDPDEAQEQAEQLLKARSLSSYYDEVALKGLQLAAGDAQRGVLSPEQLERVQETVRSLVDELDAHDDSDPSPDTAVNDAAGPTAAERALPKHPAPGPRRIAREDLPAAWRGDSAILCVAGRGPLDEGAAAMLAQLLGKHGLPTRIVAHDDVSRLNTAALDVEGVAMICISYIEMTGTPSHLRYLLRRLRARAPSPVMLVGLWPREEEGDLDERMQAAVGADHYAMSLRDAVQCCLREVANAGGVGGTSLAA